MTTATRTIARAGPWIVPRVSLGSVHGGHPRGIGKHLRNASPTSVLLPIPRAIFGDRDARAGQTLMLRPCLFGWTTSGASVGK